MVFLSRAARFAHRATSFDATIAAIGRGTGATLLHRSAQGCKQPMLEKCFTNMHWRSWKQTAMRNRRYVNRPIKPSGTLVALGIPQSASGALAFPLLTAVRAAYPEIVFQLTEELTGNLRAACIGAPQSGDFVRRWSIIEIRHTTHLVEEEMMFITRADSGQFAHKKKSISLRRPCRCR